MRLYNISSDFEPVKHLKTDTETGVRQLMARDIARDN